VLHSSELQELAVLLPVAEPSLQPLQSEPTQRLFPTFASFNSPHQISALIYGWAILIHREGLLRELKSNLNESGKDVRFRLAIVLFHLLGLSGTDTEFFAETKW
jgi:hypothetical protein